MCFRPVIVGGAWTDVRERLRHADTVRGRWQAREHGLGHAGHIGNVSSLTISPGSKSAGSLTGSKGGYGPWCVSPRDALQPCNRSSSSGSGRIVCSSGSGSPTTRRAGRPRLSSRFWTKPRSVALRTRRDAALLSMPRARRDGDDGGGDASAGGADRDDDEVSRTVAGTDRSAASAHEVRHELPHHAVVLERGDDGAMLIGGRGRTVQQGVRPDERGDRGEVATQPHRHGRDVSRA